MARGVWFYIVDDKVTWWCSACVQPIGEVNGYVYLDARAAMEAQALDRQREADSSLPIPEVVPTRAYHYQCDPDPGRGPYAIEVEQIDHTGNVKWRWSAHLADKTWIRFTDWQDVQADIIKDFDQRHPASG